MGRRGPKTWPGLALLALALAAPAAAAPTHRVASPTGPAALPTHREVIRSSQRFLDQRTRRDRVLPRAGSTAAALPLPASRVIAFYGAPQMGATVLGRTSPRNAAAKLARQAEPYTALGERPVIGGFDLVSVFATAGGGPDGLYRSRQADEIISIYLEQARAVGARLVLDIQPGRSSFRTELRELHEWVLQPDVDVALDPEWNVGRHGVPGRTEGSVSAPNVNRVARRLDRVAAAHGLPPKLLVVHQFRRASVTGRRRIVELEHVQTVLNFDGIGSPGAKQSGYAALGAPGLFNGFSLFYRRDAPLMSPASVLALEPQPDFLLYQ